MKDFLGNPLEVGDEVVCIQKDYKNLVKACVVKITAKTIFVEYMHQRRIADVKRTSDQVVKI